MSSSPRKSLPYLLPPLLALLLFLAGAVKAQPTAEINLAFKDIPEDGTLFKQISIGAAKTLFDKADISQYKVSFHSDNRSFDVQLVPNPFFGRDNYNAMILIHAPGHRNLEGKLQFTSGRNAATNAIISDSYTVSTSAAQWKFTPKEEGVFPYEVSLTGSGKTYKNFTWGDRVYDPALGSFSLTNDKSGSLVVLSEGPIATVLRARAEYYQQAKATPGKATATYDWYFFKDSPAVFVDAYQTATGAYQWSQSVFLEWIFKEQYFKNHLGSEDKKLIELTGGKKSTTAQKWAALVSNTDTIAYIGDQATVHDGVGSYGNYIRSANPSPTLGWNSQKRRLTGWLWVSSAGSSEKLPAELDKAALSATSRFVQTEVILGDSPVPKMAISGTSQFEKWQIALLRREFGLGRLSSSQSGKLQLPTTWRFMQSGELGIALDVGKDGARLISLYDLQKNRELLADEAAPLFELSFFDRTQNKDVAFDAQRGWDSVAFQKTANGFQLDFHSRDTQSNPIAVTVSASGRSGDSAWEWKIKVDNAKSAWSIKDTLFPQVSLKRLSNDTRSFIPLQSGVVVEEPFLKKLHYDRIYPTGGCTMQFMAVYQGGENSSGLYVAQHDPGAARKRLLLDTNNIELTTKLSFSQVAENPETPGNTFATTGSGVWKLIRGDWFDAAKYYKQWAEREARWWPEINTDGRVDTPLWFRQLNVWSTRGGEVNAAREALQKMKRYTELPLMNHWYYWHQIPFDNDYPHYFPTVPGFAETVKALQQEDIHVMPYINGRLWDTRDKGAEDFEYTREALPWTTKVTSGTTLKPFTSTFRSKESDGSLASLAVMCPYTKFWQNKVTGIVKRLTDEQNVNGVYLDQIGASPPILCMDPSHGHPLGGGDWWVEGYNRMLSQIQQTIPAQKIITTEDNAEPYMKYLDGVLTWQWLNNGQVPAFSAVYGSAVQMFGRSYTAVGNEDPNLSVRMKAGQQLTFGEQIGWISPDFLFGRLNEQTRDYFKRIIHSRNKINAYIYAGEMLRAPQLEGNNPTITANWKAGGPVTLNSVLTGAWKKHGARKAALVFTNVSPDTRELKYRFNPGDYGIPSRDYVITRWDSSNPSQAETVNLDKGTATLSLPELSVVVWEISWK